MLAGVGKPVFAKAAAGKTEFGLLPAWVFRFTMVDDMANYFFNGGFLNNESRGIALPAIILAVSSILSRLLGIWRDWLLAERFGASSDLDAYFAAFRVPDLIYNILVFGGIVVAFLPLFSQYYVKDKLLAWRFANNVLNVFFGLLVLFSTVLFIFMPQTIALVAPGFSQQQMSETVLLSRLMFLSPIIFGIASIFSGILQYFKRFIAYSFAASLYNLGIIAGIIFLTPAMGITGAAVGVIIGALFYLLIQMIPAFQCGFSWRPIFDLRDGSIRRVFMMMFPRTMGIAANQINLIVPTVIASLMATGSIVIFNLSNNLAAIPVGIIGVSWATAAFASFSRSAAQGDRERLAAKFSESWRQAGYLALPAGILIFVLRDQIVEILYRHGQFSGAAAALTSASLGLFCLGIYFSSIMPLIFRLFFALRDTATPTWTTVISVVANIGMNLFFVDILKSGSWGVIFRDFFGLQGAGDISVLGLAIAYSLANILQFVLLVFLLEYKQPGLMRAKEVVQSFLKSAAAGIFMAIGVYFVIDVLWRPGFIQELTALAAALIAGGAIYILATILMKSEEAILVKLQIERKWSKKITTNQK